jgi:hypothetical protein
MGYETVPDSQLIAWRKEALESIRKASAASALYNERKPGVVNHIRESTRIYGEGDYNARKALKENWTLNDAQDVYNWHRRNANMLNQAIATELALRQMPSGE